MVLKSDLGHIALIVGKIKYLSFSTVNMELIPKNNPNIYCILLLTVSDLLL